MLNLWGIFYIFSWYILLSCGESHKLHNMEPKTKWRLLLWASGIDSAFPMILRKFSTVAKAESNVLTAVSKREMDVRIQWERETFEDREVWERFFYILNCGEASKLDGSRKLKTFVWNIFKMIENIV